MQEPVSITPVKELADRVAWARARLGLSQEQLAEKAGVSQGTIGNIESGLRKKPREVVALATALEVRPEWLTSGMGRPEIFTQQANSVDMAQLMSQARNYSTPLVVKWEGLMSADLSRPFELEVKDGSFGGEIPAGCVMRLDPNRQPRAGWPLLVRDKAGKFYLRDYQEGAGGRWQAVARVRGFAPLDSEDDGLQIIAVMKGVDYL